MINFANSQVRGLSLDRNAGYSTASELRGALATIDCHIRGYIDNARLGNAT
jgi:hypothetical protein